MLPLFRVLVRLWHVDAPGRPLLALLASLARDPLLRATAEVIIPMPEGAELHRGALREALIVAVRDRLNDATLNKVVRNAASSWSQSGHLKGRTFKSRRRVEATADTYFGSKPGQTERVVRFHWELPHALDGLWLFMESCPDGLRDYSGKSEVCLTPASARAQNITEFGVRGKDAWGKPGVIFSRMRSLPSGLYIGQFFDSNAYVIAPKSAQFLAAIYAFARSAAFNATARQYNQHLNITRELTEKLPFDLAHWRCVAAEKYPDGLPKPHSDHPTQWLFQGHPKGSDHPLQVAVARLVGYRWPRQTGASFPDCPALGPDGLEKHADSDGIVCLSSLGGEAPAADRLRALLADAYGNEWSAAKLHELLGDCESLEIWLRDRFFEEHCQIFHRRPFVWHVWDGRRDGFHALLNYHNLAAANGDGRKTLERLIYTLLGDWITRQRSEVALNVEGADACLAAALHLKSELEKILEGEKPYDIFVRWKPVHEQPIGWEPDINDGVRLNIRPWLIAKPYQPSRKDACILRVTPRISYGKDRGKEPRRDPNDFPWFADSQERNNNIHLSIKDKQPARQRRSREVQPAQNRHA